MKKLMVFIVALALTCMFSKMASADLTDGLAAYYPFNGNANDESGNGNNGTVYGATLSSDRFGNLNSAYSFDGIDDYVRIPDSDSLDITGDLTISAWLNTDTSDFSIIFSNVLQVSPHDGYSLEISQGKVRFMSGDQLFYGNTQLNTGTWKHIAVTLSGTTATSYVDGVFDSSGTVGIPTTNTIDQTIGASDLPFYFFQGIIDDIRIYNRALSEVEIQELQTLNVDIYIKPNSFPNSINLKSKGNVPVAILSSPTFDAATVDRGTVEFAGARALAIGGTPEDVNGDGLLDLVLHFSTQSLNLKPGDTEACLTGKTLSEQEFEGCDSVNIVK